MEITIEQLIKDRISELDIESIVTEYIEEQMGRKVRDAIESGIKKIDTRIGDIFEKEISSIMSKEIVINDGWNGVNKKYDSFEQLFKDKFSAKVANDREYQNALGKAIKERVDTYMNQISKESIDKIVDVITKTTIVKAK